VSLGAKPEMTPSRTVLAVPLALLMAGAACHGCRDPAEGLQSSDAQERREALTALAKEDTEGAVRQVVEMVAHEDMTTARDAVWALGRMSNQRAAEAVSKVALGDARPGVRKEAAAALGRRPAEASVRTLRRMVQSDQSSEVRAEAAASLGNVGSTADVDLLVQVVESADTPETLAVQSRAIGAVERLVGLNFYYDAKAPPGERQKALARMRMIARAAAANLPSKDEDKE